MRRLDTQHPLRFTKVLSGDNTAGYMLPEYPEPIQFSDADSKAQSPAVDHTNPKHLLAVMIQTRRMCRSDGLISRDRQELYAIGHRLKVSPSTIDRIISLMLISEPRSGLSGAQIADLETLPLGSTHTKKTRNKVRVFLGLSIWALTIAVVMQMV